MRDPELMLGGSKDGDEIVEDDPGVAARAHSEAIESMLSRGLQQTPGDIDSGGVIGDVNEICDESFRQWLLRTVREWKQIERLACEFFVDESDAVLAEVLRFQTPRLRLLICGSRV